MDKEDEASKGTRKLIRIRLWMWNICIFFLQILALNELIQAPIYICANTYHPKDILTFIQGKEKLQLNRKKGLKRADEINRELDS